MKTIPQKHIGRTFRFDGKNVLIQDIVQNGDVGFYVFLDSGKRVKVTAAEFQEKFVPVQTVADSAPEIVVYKGFEKDQGTMATLEAVLLENIQRIKEDPAFIKSAEAIGRQAKHIIDIQRAKISAVVALRRK